MEQQLTTTQSVQQPADSIQAEFYDNISSGGVWPTILAIIIISI